MTFDKFLVLLTQHWVLISLVLCPIVVVVLALAALTCEACSAPFGIFRRRQRTIDLCLRCAVLHDIRRAKEMRKPNANSLVSDAPPADKSADSERQSRQETGREERRYSTQSPASTDVRARAQRAFHQNI